MIYLESVDIINCSRLQSDTTKTYHLTKAPSLHYPVDTFCLNIAVLLLVGHPGVDEQADDVVKVQQAVLPLLGCSPPCSQQLPKFSSRSCRLEAINCKARKANKVWESRYSIGYQWK